MLKPTNAAAASWCAVALLAAACASTEYDVPDLFHGECVKVTVADPGFVRGGDGRRVPKEAFVLALRRRLRAMEREERADIWVLLDRTEDSDAADVDFLVSQFQLMGILQIKHG